MNYAESPSGPLVARFTASSWVLLSFRANLFLLVAHLHAVAFRTKREPSFQGLAGPGYESLLRRQGADQHDGVGERCDDLAGVIVIWSGDPLEVTTLAEAVVLGGRSIPLVSRQTLLRDRYLPQDPPLPRAYLNSAPD